MNKIFTITLICIAQYLCMGFFGEGLMTILREDGMSLQKVGLLRFMGFSLVFGFLLAPIIDKMANGRYKNIMLVLHCFTIAILIVISFLNIKQNLSVIIILAVFLSFIATASTVCSNAFFMRISTSLELGKINALKFAGIMLGHIFANGLTLIIYAKFGWGYAIWFLIVLTIISVINLLNYPKDRRKNDTFNVGFKNMISFFKDKKAWLSVLFLQSIAICTAFGILSPMLVDLGWELDKIGEVLHIYGMIFGFLGSIVVSFFIDKFGAKQSLMATVFAQALIILIILLPINGYTGYFTVLFTCAMMYIVYVVQMAILSTIMMQKSPNILASEYAIQSSANMFFQFIAFYIGIVLAHYFGYEFVVVASSFFCLAIFVYFVKIYKFI